jgi:hypothetical protein
MLVDSRRDVGLMEQDITKEEGEVKERAEALEL